MKLLHSESEIRMLDKKSEISRELVTLFDKNNKMFEELLDLALKYQHDVSIELAKYNDFIGMVCLAPPSFLSDDKNWRKGTIKEITHFNGNSHSVRVRFQYDNTTVRGGGWNEHSLLELKEI